MVQDIFPQAIANIEEDEFNTYDVIFQLLQIDHGHEYIGQLISFEHYDDPFRQFHSFIGKELNRLSQQLSIEMITDIEGIPSKDALTSIRNTPTRAQLWRKVRI